MSRAHVHTQRRAPFRRRKIIMSDVVKPTRNRMAMNAVLRYPEQRRALEGSPSLPNLRRQPRTVTSNSPPSLSPPTLPGQTGVDKMLGNLITYTEDEMRARGLSRHGPTSEGRLAVWREALALFAEQMPSSQRFLAQVMVEFDHAIAGLVAEVQDSEHKLSAAWSAQERAEDRAVAAKRDAEKLVKNILARRDADEARSATANEERSRSHLTVELTLNSIFELAEHQRLECISQAVERLPIPRRRYLLLRSMRKLPASERSTMLLALLSTGRREAGPATSPTVAGETGGPSSRDVGGVDDVDSASVEALLDVMPERLRARLGMMCFQSLSDTTRADSLSAVHVSAGTTSTAPTDKQTALLQEAQAAADSSRLEVIQLKKEVRQLHVTLHLTRAERRLSPNAAKMEPVDSVKEGTVPTHVA